MVHLEYHQTCSILTKSICVVHVPFDHVDVPVWKRLSGVQHYECRIIISFEAITYGIEFRPICTRHEHLKGLRCSLIPFPATRFQLRSPLSQTQQDLNAHLLRYRERSFHPGASRSLFSTDATFPVLRLFEKSGAGGPVLSTVDEWRKSSNMIMFNDVRHSEQVPPPTNTSVVLCRRL